MGQLASLPTKELSLSEMEGITDYAAFVKEGCLDSKERPRPAYDFTGFSFGD